MTAPTPQPPSPAPVSTSLSPQFPKSSKKYRIAWQWGGEGAQSSTEEQGPRFSKPDPSANPGKTVSPQILNRTRLSHVTFIHILYFGIFQRTGRDKVGHRLRQEGKGGPGSPFASHPSWPCHTGSTHKGGGEAQKPPRWRRRHKATPTPHTHAHPHPRTHTNKPAPHRAGGITEAERCGVKGREATVSSQTGGRPLPPPPTPFPRSPQSPPHPTLCLAILSWPLASSLLLGTKRKGVPSREVSIPQPHSSCWAVRPPGALRAGS